MTASFCAVRPMSRGSAGSRVRLPAFDGSDPDPVRVGRARWLVPATSATPLQRETGCGQTTALQPDSVSRGGLRGGRRQECTSHNGGGAYDQTGRGLVTQDAFAPGQARQCARLRTGNRAGSIRQIQRSLLAAREFMRLHS